MSRNGKRTDEYLPGRSIQELRVELRDKIAWFIGASEKLLTRIPEVMLVRRTAPSEPCSGTYLPGVIVVAQGSKRVDLGQTTFIYDESRFLLTSIDLPIVSQVVKASEEQPLLAMAIKLQMPLVRELLSREEIRDRHAVSGSPAMVTGEVTAEMLDVLPPPGSPQPSRRYSLSQPPTPARNHLSASPRSRRRAPSGHRHFRRSKLSHCQGHLLDQGKLRETGSRR